MIMIFHKAIDMNLYPIPFVGRFQIGEESLSVSLIAENRLSFIPPRGYMIECAGELDSERPGQPEPPLKIFTIPYQEAPDLSNVET
jgi:hypothetical protein